MLDVLFLAISVLFFIAAAAYVSGCERLASPVKASEPRQ